MTRAPAAAPDGRRMSTAPSRTEQEADAGSERQRRIRPTLQRLIDRIDHVVADLADRADAFHRLVLHVGYDTTDVGLGFSPSCATAIGKNVADLRGQLGDVLAQCGEIVLQVFRSRRSGLARI